MLDRITRHVPHSLRRLVTAPVFTVVIIVTLAIAIGATAAVFTLIDQLLLKPLPVREPDTLVIVNAHSMPRLRGGSATTADRGPNGMILWGMNYSLYTTLAERVPVFQTTFARRLLRGTVLVGDTPVEALGEFQHRPGSVTRPGIQTRPARPPGRAVDGASVRRRDAGALSL